MRQQGVQVADTILAGMVIKGDADQQTYTYGEVSCDETLYLQVTSVQGWTVTTTLSHLSSGIRRTGWTGPGGR
jgi:hypothetical protein